MESTKLWDPVAKLIQILQFFRMAQARYLENGQKLLMNNSCTGKPADSKGALSKGYSSLSKLISIIIVRTLHFLLSGIGTIFTVAVITGKIMPCVRKNAEIKRSKAETYPALSMMITSK